MKLLLIIATLCFVCEDVSSQTKEDYCKLYSQHTVCVKPVVGKACKLGYKRQFPVSVVVIEILKWHNELRSKAANGLINFGTIGTPNTNPGSPTGMNMNATTNTSSGSPIGMNATTNTSSVSPTGTNETTNTSTGSPIGTNETTNISSGSPNGTNGTLTGTTNSTQNPTPTDILTASNMVQLKWDKELARTAQWSADQCEFTSDCDRCRGDIKGKFSLVGQIIISRRSLSYSEKVDFVSVLSQIERENSYLKTDLIDRFSKGSNYERISQITWANTRYVGCGASIFRVGVWTYHLIVCNYGPSGNINGQSIFKKGLPCTGCPAGTSCVANQTSLCD